MAEFYFYSYNSSMDDMYEAIAILTRPNYVRFIKNINGCRDCINNEYYQSNDDLYQFYRPLTDLEKIKYL